MVDTKAVSNSQEISNGSLCYHSSTPNTAQKERDVSSLEEYPKNVSSGFAEDACIEYFLILHKEGQKEEALWSYPKPVSVVLEKYPNLLHFVFASSGTSFAVDDLSYTFVLTNDEGVRVYGHCTAFVNGEAVVSLSPYPWCRFFLRIASFVRVNGQERGKDLVRALCRCPTPPPGGCFQVPNMTSITFKRPYDRLCSFIDTSPLDLLSIFPDTGAFFSILADLLLEKHIIVVGPNFGLVSNVVMSLQSLISPFDWLHTLIPILPSNLLDVLGAPPPYLVGLLTSQLPMIDRIPIESCVMIQLGSSGKCEEVIYYNEVRHNLPQSGPFSALRIGYNILKMRKFREHTVRDLCSLFLTYYASVLGDIGLGGARSFIRSRSDEEDVPFYDLLLSTQSFSALYDTVCEALADNDHRWMENEFIVAIVRGHPQSYPGHYALLISEENRGGGYAARYENCFGSREAFTALSAAVHGFGGHHMSIGKLVCQCLCGCLTRQREEENERAAVVIETVGRSISRRRYLSASLDTPSYEPCGEMLENGNGNGSH